LTGTKQHDDEDLVDYTRRFKAVRDIMESHIGSKLKIEKMAKADPAWNNQDQAVIEECHEKAFARLMALLYLENADQAKYGSIFKGLGNQFPLTKISIQRQSPMHPTS
jgi:hypothetical protein